MTERAPIFITGVERSGSTLVAKILDISKVFSGKCNNMFENKAVQELMENFLAANPNHEFMPDTEEMYIPADWSRKVNGVMVKEGCGGKEWMCKSAQLSQMWPVWNYAYPNARWIIVRRRTGDIISSCLKTAYMRSRFD